VTICPFSCLPGWRWPVSSRRAVSALRHARFGLRHLLRSRLRAAPGSSFILINAFQVWYAHVNSARSTAGLGNVVDTKLSDGGVGPRLAIIEDATEVFNSRVGVLTTGRRTENGRRLSIFITRADRVLSAMGVEFAKITISC
jgi:hypothetical protein